MQDIGATRDGFSRAGGAMANTAQPGGRHSDDGPLPGQTRLFWENQSSAPLKVELPNGALIHGSAVPAFRPVWDAFVKNFTDRNEIGASLAISHKGVPVLEAWGGFADAAAAQPLQPWRRDTVSLVFSCTKGATALCAHILAARGLLDLDAPVSQYWPEFAANGKQNATVGMLLDHSVGLPALRDPVPLNGWADWSYMAARLAAEAPWWEPGSAHGYHALTYGWLVGEVVRRVSGVSLGTFFAREIAGPLGLDFHIGAPASIEPRIASMRLPTEVLPTDKFTTKSLTDPASVQALCFNVGGWLEPAVFDSPEGHQAEIPGANGIANAQSLAAMYAVLANGGASQGVRLLPADYVTQLGMIQTASHSDRVTLAQTRFGLGFLNSLDNRKTGANMSFLIGVHAFGHPGFGGSFGFADPQANLSFGYSMNCMGPGNTINERGQSLADAVYQTLGYTSTRYGCWI